MHEQPSVAEEQERVAVLRLVHHVARHEQGLAPLGEPVEQRPEVAAEHGIEPHGRLVEDEDLGLPEERHREGDARLLAARQTRDDVVRMAAQRDVRHRACYGFPFGSEDSGEEAKVLAHREVAVDRNRLRHVRNPGAKRSRARRDAENLDRPGGDQLYADDRTDERRLPASARSEEAGHDATADLAAQLR
jgi:hypothetical protein